MPSIRSMRVATAALLSLSVAVIAGCGGGGGSSGGSSAKTGDLAVRVVDARQTSVTLEGARVTVTAGATTKTETTPASGVVTFTNLPAGSATVNVERDLFRPYTTQGTIQGASAVALTAPMQRRTGEVAATAKDTFDTGVVNARVEIVVEGQTLRGTTNASGVATIAGVPTGTVPVAISADGYLAEPSKSVTVAENATSNVGFELDRVTQPGGGYTPPGGGFTPPTSPPTVPVPPTNAGQTLELRLELVVVDENGIPINNLAAGDFSLLACTPVAGGTPECVRSPTDPAFDAAYTVANAVPGTFSVVAPQAPAPYAVAMLLDQSGSVSTSDPTDARVFSSKVFLEKLGASDRVTLGVFAQGTGARIPTTPLTRYGDFTGDGASLFDELDGLPALEGGFTPLYSALDQMVQYVAANAPAGLRKSVVLFTDGRDTICPAAQLATCRSNSINLANTNGVDIFTVGLGTSVDTASLTELSYNTGGIHLVASNPQQMISIFGSLGNLLSGNVATYRATWTINAAAANVFLSGGEVLGTINVRVGTRTIVLPFVYKVP
jgi:hypothetical protein